MIRGGPSTRPNPRPRPGSVHEPEILTAEQIRQQVDDDSDGSVIWSTADVDKAAELGHNNGIQACINAIKKMSIADITDAGTITAALSKLKEPQP